MLNERRLNRIIRDVINETIGKTHDPYEFWDKVEQLGFDYQLTSAEYDGGGRSLYIRSYFIPEEKYSEDVVRKLKQLCNFYGFQIISHSNGITQNFYGRYGWGCRIEAKYGAEYDYRDSDDEFSNVFFHATLDRKVNKILRQGLVPKDDGKLGVDRSSRIYLSKYYNDFLFRSVTKNDEDEDYTVLKIDLRKTRNKPRLYKDEWANDSYYTCDNIPPECISIPFNEHKFLKQVKQRLKTEIADRYSFRMKVNNPYVHYPGQSYIHLDGSVPNKFGSETNFTIKIDKKGSSRNKGGKYVWDVKSNKRRYGKDKSVRTKYYKLKKFNITTDEMFELIRQWVESEM